MYKRIVNFAIANPVLTNTTQMTSTPSMKITKTTNMTTTTHINTKTHSSSTALTPNKANIENTPIIGTHMIIF